jgi:hypothetical protein
MIRVSRIQCLGPVLSELQIVCSHQSQHQRGPRETQWTVVWGIEGVSREGLCIDFSIAGCKDSSCDCSGRVCIFPVIDEECLEGFNQGWKAVE